MPSGTLSGRSRSLGGQLVDDQGELVTFTNEGEPRCYDSVVSVVSCDEPGARPPSDDPG